MAIKKTYGLGNKIVRSKSKKIVNFSDPKLNILIKDLKDTMRKGNLVGMAAPQIGQSLRVFVTEVRNTAYRKNVVKKDGFRVFINPKIIKQSKNKVSGYEGCGSVALAQIFGPVSRSKEVTVKAFDDNGQEFICEDSGLLARVIQHELDHLNGIVFIDHITDTKKLLNREEYLKLKK